MKKLTGIILGIATVALVTALSFEMSRTAVAGTGDNVTGYAWSDTIGWISLNNLNTGDATSYGVNIDSTGTISGYGWSPNIGWVSFNASQLSSCPSGTCAPTLNWTTGTVSGWARACAGTSTGNCSSSTSRTDGWDGWIQLSGLTVNTTTGDFSGYAWGSDVVGWVDFSGVNVGSPPAPTANITVTPNPVDYGSTVTVTWTSNAASCTASSGPGFSTGNAASGSDTSSALTANATFAITCDNGTSDSQAVTVQSVCGDGVVTGGEQCDGGSGQCTAISGGGYASGTYTCTGSCTYNTASCVATPPLLGTQCDDAIDNDSDGYTDYDKNGDGVRDADADPGCTSTADTSEFNIGSIRPR